MRRIDPRAQLAWVATVVIVLILGGTAGLLAGAALAAAGVASTRGWRPWLRLLTGIAPLLLVLLGLDTLAGAPMAGLYVGARIVVLATVGLAFARATDAERLVAGLRALRVPYAVTFVLVAGARFVPTTLADLADLRDAARLRGVTVEGSPLARLRGWGVLLVPLVVATIRRGLQLGEAMEARGFGAAPERTLRHHLAWRAGDTLALVTALVLALIVFAGPRLVFGYART